LRLLNAEHGSRGRADDGAGDRAVLVLPAVVNGLAVRRRGEKVRAGAALEEKRSGENLGPGPVEKAPIASPTMPKTRSAVPVVAAFLRKPAVTAPDPLIRATAPE
jgi:hypothetical protein